MLRTKFGEFNAKEFIYFIYILENVLTIIGKRWNKIFSLFLKFDLSLSQVESSSAPILPIRFFVHPIYIYIFYHSFNPCPISTRVCARIHTLARVKRVRARRRAVHHVCIQDRGGSCETAVRAFLPAPSSVRRTGAPVAWRIHGRKKRRRKKEREKGSKSGRTADARQRKRGLVQRRHRKRQRPARAVRATTEARAEKNNKRALSTLNGTLNSPPASRGQGSG